MELMQILKLGIEKNASDIHLVVNAPPVFRINGSLMRFGEKSLSLNDIEKFIDEILNKNQQMKLSSIGEVDTSFSISLNERFRVNVYKQKEGFGISLRIIPLKIPKIKELGLPLIIKDITKYSRGLILVTGPTGSGKSTTLAAMIDLINNEKSCHIITLEDPIEYSHIHKKSIVNQREIGIDSLNFSNALRAALRQDPDVILIGEMRDIETISIALTAAETGHLVLSTLHTLGAAKTIDRIIDVFPYYQQQQIRIQIASVLQSIISQQLLLKADNSERIAAFEIMIATPAIRNLIREEKTYQINTAIQTGGKYGMETMDNFILNLCKKGIITKETALDRAFDVDIIRKNI